MNIRTYAYKDGRPHAGTSHTQFGQQGNTVHNHGPLTTSRNEHALLTIPNCLLFHIDGTVRFPLHTALHCTIPHSTYHMAYTTLFSPASLSCTLPIPFPRKFQNHIGSPLSSPSPQPHQKAHLSRKSGNNGPCTPCSSDMYHTNQNKFFSFPSTISLPAYGISRWDIYGC